uniref:hypothetical protein n=1 Tax=Bacteroides finegoldii TaxID=338188 RepID=UPI001E558921
MALLNSNWDISKIIKLKATTSLRVSCLFCIFKHSPPKNGLTAKTGVIRDIPKIIKLKATTSLRISCLFCIFKH